MDGKARWSGHRSSAGKGSELVWEARRRFQATQRRSSGAAISTADNAWQGAVEDDTSTVCLLEGQLVKQPRGRSHSILKGTAKTRYFKLFQDRLRYFAQEKQGMNEKGSIEAKSICVVEELNDDLYGKHTFQIMTSYEDRKKGTVSEGLYLTAPSDKERDAWMLEIRLLCYVKGNIMQSHFHPDLLHGSDWHCCKNSAKILGCQLSYDYPSFATYTADVVEDSVKPLKKGPPSTPVSPLHSIDVEDEPSRTKEARSVSLSEVTEMLHEAEVADDVKAEAEERQRSETLAVGSPGGKNPFIKSMIRRQSEQQSARPPKPSRDNRKRATPFDKQLSVADEKATESTEPSEPSEPGPATHGESSASSASTSESQPVSGMPTLDTATATATAAAVMHGSTEQVPAQDTGDTTAPASWQPQWPELSPADVTEETVVSNADADSPVPAASPTDSPVPVASPTASGALENKQVTVTVTDSSVTTDAGDELDGNAAEPEPAAAATTTAAAAASAVSAAAEEAEEEAKSPTEDINPFGDSDDFSSLKLPEAHSLMATSESSVSLASLSSGTDVLKIPAPPRSPSLASLSSGADALKIPGPPKSPEGRRSRTVSSSSLTSPGSDSLSLAPGEEQALDVRPTPSESSASPESSGPGSGGPTSPPPSKPSRQSEIVVDLITLDTDDESTNASLLKSGLGRNRSASALGKIMPQIFRPNSSKDSKNRLSMISTSSVNGAEMFDVVELGDCEQGSSGQQRSHSLATETLNPFKALHQACQQGLVEEVRRQLEAGVNPDEPEMDSRQPPIFIAYNHDHMEVLDVLLSSGGAQVNMTMGGATLLHSAAHTNNVTVINKLMKYKAQVDLKDWQLRTPLHLACGSGHLEAAELLIANGADLTLADQDCCTALHMCCWRGHTRVAELLLDHDAPAFTKNKADLTPLDLAVKEGHREVTNILRTLLPDTEQTYVSRHSFRAHRKDVNTLAILPDLSILTGASDNKICIWDSSDVNGPAFQRKFNNTILSSAVHKSEERCLVAVGSDAVQVLDLKQAGWRVMILDEPQSAYQDEQLYLVAFSPTGILATAGVVSGSEVLIWDLFDKQAGLVRKPRRTIQVAQDIPAVIHNIQFSPRADRPVLAVSIQPGKDRLAPSGNNIICTFDWTSGSQLKQFDTGHEEAACDLSMVFSTHGRYLLTGSSSGKVSVWTTSSGLLLNEIQLQADVPVRNVAFSGNGHTLAIASETGKVDLYNIATGKPFFLPEQYEQRPAVALSFSKAGDSLAAGYDDGTVQVWNVVGGKMQPAASEVEAYSPFEYKQVIHPNGEMSTTSREFLRREFVKLDSDKSGSLDQAQLANYFQVYLNTSVTPDMFTDLQENYLTDADLGGLTTEGFANMAFQHFCLDPDSMWPIWQDQGFSPPV